jgi:hypothetical protein
LVGAGIADEDRELFTAIAGEVATGADRGSQAPAIAIRT